MFICVSCAKKQKVEPAPIIYFPPPVVQPAAEVPPPVTPKPTKPVAIKPIPKQAEITLGEVVVENPK